MKMGLGIWKFTTLILLFDLAFMEKVEGKRMNPLEFRHILLNGTTVSPEDKIMYAYFDCAKNWKPSIGQKCLHPDDVEIEYGRQIREVLPLDEAYLAAIKATRMICDAEPGANCTLGFCTCYDSSGSCTRHKQNLMQDCKKEFLAIWPIIRNTTQSKFTNQSKTKLESRQRFNSEVTDDEFEVTSILYGCALVWRPKSGEPCISEFEVGKTLREVRSLSLAEAYLKSKEIFEKRCDVDRGFSCYEEICRCSGTKCTETHVDDITKNCVKEFRAYFEYVKRNRGNSIFGPRPRFEYMLWTALIFIVVVNFG